VNPYKVQIIGNGMGMGCVIKVVFAISPKEALVAVLKSLHEDDAAWQWAGWQVQVFPMKDAFLVKGVIP